MFMDKRYKQTDVIWWNKSEHLCLSLFFHFVCNDLKQNYINYRKILQAVINAAAEVWKISTPISHVSPLFY